MLVQVKPTKIRSLSDIINVSGALTPSIHKASSWFDDRDDTIQPRQPGNSLDDVTYTKLVQSSTQSGCSTHGKLVQSHMIKTGYNPTLFLHNTLLNMYFKCNESDIALQLFDEMPERNVVSWNSLISGYTRLGQFVLAKKAFSEARITNVNLSKYTYATMLSICAQTGDLELGKVIHSLIISTGVGIDAFLTNPLIAMYSKCGRVDQARITFNKCEQLDDVSWNSMISGYVKSGLHNEMLQILIKMHQCGVRFSSYVLGSVLNACCLNSNRCLIFGKLIHSCCIKLGWDLDIVVGTALLDMYAKIGDLDDAVLTFNLVPDKNIVMYNAMISGLVKFGRNKECLNLFVEMQRNGFRFSEFTFSTMIKACEGFESGRQIHGLVCKNNFEKDEYVGSVLVEFYSRWGEMGDAVICFDKSKKKDIVIWTSMIVGHAQNGEFEKGLVVFCEMIGFGLKVDEFTVSSVLSCCGNLGGVRCGEEVHGYAVKSGVVGSGVVGNSLIYMYGKAGDLECAKRVFEVVADKCDVVAWSVMICGYAHCGCGEGSLRVFEMMIGSGVVPNDVAFLGVLTACSHGGLVEEGLRYYESMKGKYGISPTEKHCACMVDLLGRAGRLSEAESFIMDSGFSNAPVMWRALLSSCRIHKNTDIGKQSAERLIELEPESSSSYVLLYNIYNDAGMKSEAMKIRDMMSDRRVKKEPGLSWIEVGNRVSSFLVGDKSHPQSESIYLKLKDVLEKIKKVGYKDGNGFMVNPHSEKLAVCFGLIGLSRLGPVRVMKNLRVCDDCHDVMKLVSKVEKREIVLRDPIRFHRFRDGVCSCGDYW